MGAVRSDAFRMTGARGLAKVPPTTMGPARSSSLFMLLWAAALAGSGCRGQGGVPFVPKNDAGTETILCSTTTDCGGQGICVAGICQQVRSCQTDDECADDGKVCHSNRFYCVECDGMHAGECPANYTCQFDFTCVMVGGSPDAGTNACSGSCTDRSECGTDNVCKNNSCCPPPARCLSPADCPVSAPECNGATGECFGGDGCFADNDCNDQPGCAGGVCKCDIPQTPPGTCRLRQDECQSDEDCKMNGAYVGMFCSINTPPKRCLPAPNCTSDTQCQNDGLVCDLAPGSESNGKCVNGSPCTPGGGECNASTQTCVNNVCVAKNCNNTPALCTAGQTCDPGSGQCVSSACTGDTDCQGGFWCNTAMSPPMCEVGCRDNSECNGGVCDASHRCQGTMNGLCGGCTDDTQCPAGARCVDATGLCHETCSTITGQMCSDPNRQCIFGNCSCLF